MENSKKNYMLSDKQLIKCLATQSYNFRFYLNNVAVTHCGPDCVVHFQMAFEKK